MLPLEPIVDVVVNTSSPNISPGVFDVGLIICPCSAVTGLMTYNNYEEAIAGVTEAEFSSSSQMYKAVQKYYGVSPAPTKLLVYFYSTASGSTINTPALALAAVLNITTEFYGVVLIGVTDEQKIRDLDATIRASNHPMMFFCPIPAPVETAIDDDELLAYFHGISSNRIISTYVSQPQECAAIMGIAMGLARTHPDSAFNLCYKTINGVQDQRVTQTEMNELYALNCNLYVKRGSNIYVYEKGVTACGLRYDEVMYVDQIANELQISLLDLFINSDSKLSQEDSTTALFISECNRVLEKFYDMNVLETSPWHGRSIGNVATGDILEHGYTCIADSFNSQSVADRAARISVPITILLCLSGSVESIVITLNVQQ